VLSASYIEGLHDDVLSLMWPDVEPVARGEYRDRGLVESAAGRPFQTVGGAEVYRTLTTKAAALFHSLIANHPFQNGNKRTSILAAELFLTANSYLLALAPDEMYTLAKATATYREQSRSHDEMLTEITVKFEDAAVSFSALRKHAADEQLYRVVLENRRAVRQDPRNYRLQT
jgi:death-on-curing family protein